MRAPPASKPNSIERSGQLRQGVTVVILLTCPINAATSQPHVMPTRPLIENSPLDHRPLTMWMYSELTSNPSYTCAG